jgi:putative peptidoglycan lipid II flippase
MIIGILCVKCLGFVREVFIAKTFGTGATIGIYFQIFSVASVIFTAVGVALSTFVIKSINKADTLDEKKFVGTFFKTAIVYSTIVIAMLYALSYPITKILLPGLNDSDFNNALKLFHIMLPSFLFIVLTYTSMGLLQNKNKFFITSIVSLPFNIIIISGLFFGINDIFLLGIITTIGWVAHFLFLLPSLLKEKYKLWANTNDYISLKVVKPLDIVFIFVSNIVFQLLFIIDKSSVSANKELISVIQYSSTLFITVSSIFIVAMSAVFFPSITKAIGEKDEMRLGNLVKYALTFMFAIFIPFLVIVCLYNKDIISLLYGRGKFDTNAVNMVSTAFLVYSFCIFGYITQELVFKIFYAKEKFKLTVFSSIALVVLNVILNAIFKNNFIGIIASTAGICLVFAGFMFYCLSKEIKNIFTKKFIKNIFAVLIGSSSFVVMFFLVKFYFNFQNKFMFLIPIVLGCIIYLCVLHYSGILKIVIKSNFVDEV